MDILREDQLDISETHLVCPQTSGLFVDVEMSLMYRNVTHYFRMPPQEQLVGANQTHDSNNWARRWEASQGGTFALIGLRPRGSETKIYRW